MSFNEQDKQTTIKLLKNYEKILIDDLEFFKVMKENTLTLKEIQNDLIELNEIVLKLSKEHKQWTITNQDIYISLMWKGNK